MNTTAPVGRLLREWRLRRRMSQLDCACEAEISTKHLSFLETGRSQPSREMLLKLAELLEVPLRERNVLLVAGGYAPVFAQRSLDDPAVHAARRAVDLVLKGHEPYPALAVDRHWTMLAANEAVAPLLAGVDTRLLQPPVNVLRLSLHPDGLAARILNLAQWRAHLFARLRRQIDTSADQVLIELLQELQSYPSSKVDRAGSDGCEGRGGDSPSQRGDCKVVEEPGAEDVTFAVPLRLEVEGSVLSFISTTTVFGTPLDVTLSELALETFFPADAATAARLRRL